MPPTSMRSMPRPRTGCHCERSEAISTNRALAPSLLRRCAPRNDNRGMRVMGQFGIGQPVRRFEDKRLLSGYGRFQHDRNLPGQAYAYVLRSPHAHARITAMDLSAARSAPGVQLILTGDDLAKAGLGVMGVPFQRKRPDGSPMFARAHLGLAQGKVRYVGEPVLFIVADSLAAAKDAAELVDIDYELLPSVTDTARSD